MSAADRIAETILRMGDIRAQGLQRQGDIQARQQAQSGQIWGGAIAQLGQLPVDIQKAKVLDTENQIRQNALQQQKKFQDDEFNANQIFAYTTRPDADGSIKFDEEKLNSLTQKMAEANVNPETQQRVMQAFKQGNSVVSEFRQSQLDHQVKVAKLVLGSATPDNPLTPTTALTTLKWAQANGIASADDVNKFMAGLNQGHSPEDLFKAIIQYGTQPKAPEKPIEVNPGNQLVDPTTGKVIYSAPPKAPTPGEGQKVINGQLVGPNGERIGAPVPEQVRPPAPKSLTTKAVLLDGKPTELVFDPADGSWKQGTETIDPKRIRPIPPASGGAAGSDGSKMDPGGLELAATDYRLTHRLPARNAEQNGAIISLAAKQAKELGNSPVQTVQKQAAYAGDAASLTKMKTMSAAAEAFENKALAQADIISDLSKKVSRTSFPIINNALQSGRTNITGDENATKLANAIETFSEEYAKIMNGATGGAAAASDSSRAAAKRLINAGMSQGTMQGVIDLMKREMSLTLQGYDATISHITDRMGGAPQSAAPTPAPPAASGVSVTAPNGKVYTFPTTADAAAFKARAGIK